MNAFKYIVSRRYRDYFSEEYSREFLDRYEEQEQQYERIYDELRNKKNE